MHTDWEIFKTAASEGDHIYIGEYADGVTSYIVKSPEDVNITKTFTTRSNQKPWMNAEFCSLLRPCDVAFRVGDTAALRCQGRPHTGDQGSKKGLRGETTGAPQRHRKHQANVGADGLQDQAAG